ncbi:LytTR family DNA-binding domain-containing protein [Acetobacterium woodii]|uniref:Transcriptional regulator n=1 Tax=Acetobacterium woodii (strain ATCC 29683 / DSM 1030 / JCM 2381 / KCTC 1655 / WB1) TaxID=931626 RepID=H6LBY8_ACEWD|nr:LytTR family DNA-binding domain-containing protein [Acetobacterium woodii]AFA47731.1 transcriptional regulator [Acetobacterium woodii DSM 1030]
MRLKLIQNKNQDEVEVQIIYSEMNNTVKTLIDKIKTSQSKLIGYRDNEKMVIKAEEILYIESVDKKTFLYCNNAVYQSQLKLYQVREVLKNLNFAQISKSCILNIDMLISIRPLANSRMEAVIISGERLNVNRKFIPQIKEMLKKERADINETDY